MVNRRRRVASPFGLIPFVIVLVLVLEGRQIEQEHEHDYEQRAEVAPAH
jgi:hypothetical protein